MTHDEIIEVIKAHRDGKNIEFWDCGHWHTATNCQLEDTLLFDISRGYKYRVQPEPTYVPWTADDWRDFKGKKVKLKNNEYIIKQWNNEGVYLVSVDTIKNEVRTFPKQIAYGMLLEQYRMEYGKSCGRLVE